MTLWRLLCQAGCGWYGFRFSPTVRDGKCPECRKVVIHQQVERGQPVEMVAPNGQKLRWNWTANTWEASDG